VFCYSGYLVFCYSGYLVFSGARADETCF
jgi:hypothetical protein